MENAAGTPRAPSPVSMSERIRRMDVVTVPGANGNEALHILPKPAFFPLPDGPRPYRLSQTVGEAENQPTPFFYATYLARVGDTDEYRMIMAPAALVPDNEAYNRELLSEMSNQGIPEHLVVEYAQARDLQDLFGKEDISLLPSLRVALKNGKFLERRPLGGQYSGWDPQDRSLRIIADMGPTGMDLARHYTEVATVSSIKGTKFYKVSTPVNPDSLEGTHKEAVEKILQANM